MRTDDFRQSLDALAGVDPSVDAGFARVTKKVRRHRTRTWTAVATACVVVVAVAAFGIVQRGDTAHKVTVINPAPNLGNVADFTWKRVPLPRNMTINRIVTADGKTFAVGSTPDHHPAIGLLDADGKVSQLVNPASGRPGHNAVLLLPPAATVNDLVAFRGALVAVGSMTAANGPTAAAWRSTDGGSTWQTAAIEPRPRGMAQSVNIRRALVSHDTLSLLGTPEFPAAANIRQGADQCPIYVWTSSDGRDFRTAPTFEDCGRTNNPVASGPAGVFVVNGDNATRWRRSGNEWLPIAIEPMWPASNASINDIAGNDHGYVTVGSVRANDKNVNQRVGAIWWSVDGHKWQQVATTGRPDEGFSDGAFTSVAYSSAGWIAVGRRSHPEIARGSGDASVWTSPDGVHWTQNTRDGFAFEQYAEATDVGVTADGFVIRGTTQQLDGSEVLWLGSDAASPTGTVEGSMHEVGGPAPGAAFAIRGAVTAKDAAGALHTATVGADGGFSMNLPPGRYTFLGRSPGYQGGAAACRPNGGARAVVARRVIHVDLTCQVR